MLRCPKCKSDHVTIRSRRKYLLWTAIWLSGVALCGLLFKNLLGQDLDIVVMIGIFGCPLIALILFGLGIYNLIKAIRSKSIAYYCGYCESNIDAPLLVHRSENFNSLDQIKRS